MLLFKLLGSASRAVLKNLWLGIHFIYGCFEGTVRAWVLILQLRWHLRKCRRAGRRIAEPAMAPLDVEVEEDVSSFRR